MKTLDAIIFIGCTAYLAFFAGAFNQEWHHYKEQKNREAKQEVAKLYTISHILEKVEEEA